MLAETAVSWITEFSCDLGTARACGADNILAGLDYLSEAAAARQAAAPAWKRHAAAIVTWISGHPYPPIRLRRALITTLARNSQPAAPAPEQA